MVRGLQHRFYGAYGLGAAVSVAATLTFVPVWSLHGAALAAYAAELTMIGVQTYFVASHKTEVA
jgi:O-antigen/teichoic acid export membrane protein